MLEFVYLVHQIVEWESDLVISVFRHERDALLLCEEMSRTEQQCDVSYEVRKERVLNEYNGD